MTGTTLDAGTGRPVPVGLPGGWFNVGVAAELGVGDVVPLRCFGTELVLWRSASGRAHLMSAYCPHLGAHLGHGGDVRGEHLRCPFHGWEFDGGGSCAAIPYASPVAGACLVSMPLCEVNGLIMAWRDPLNAPPSWSVPEVPEFNSERFTQFEPRSWDVPAPMWEIGENSVDVQHFASVHHTEGGVSDWWADEDGCRFTFGATMGVKSPFGVTSTNVETTQWGPGFAVTRIGGAIGICMITAATPIDERHTRIEARFSTDGAAGSRPRLARHLVRETVRQYEEDRQIWEHKIYRPAPMLAVGDGPIMRYRRWLAQFLPQDTDG
jgi:phenylpropionate dioxygenase-like ring-hydroxylating dioxygenase large terminal subunit